MQKDIRVLIVEDDPYARDLMSLLLTRDWRTQVIAEVGSMDDLKGFLLGKDERIDLMIVDTEYPKGPEWPFDIAEMANMNNNPPTILFTGTRGDQDIVRRLLANDFGGYIIKGEILYALATAVSFAAAGFQVITPGVLRLIPRNALPSGVLMLDGRKFATGLTRRERELVRLGIIFNLSIRDIADELVLSAGWVSEIVSTIYRKLGMREILAGEVPLEDVFQDEAVLTRCKQIMARGNPDKEQGTLRKAPWMATLAFHLLTQPESDEF
jgi:DNA-binding NarL/FixJ family response regulator